MKKSEFIQLIVDKLSFQPTAGQQQAITLFAAYMCCKEKEAIMLLKGYAGTGKTSLVSAFVQVLKSQKIATVLLAPTGRAAKVLGNYSDHPAFTIHKEIYQLKYNSDGSEQMVLRKNEHVNTIFFVDEASMIYDVQPDGNNSMLLFQDNNLLFNLLSYIEQGKNCRLVFIGDTAQLPPVKLTYSPALDKDFLKDNFSKIVFDCELTEVVRQVKQSGILYNATRIRSLSGGQSYSSYHFESDKFQDVNSISAGELLEVLETAYSRDNRKNVVVITRSNKQANQINQAIRSKILEKEDELEKGDFVINLKNNYFWLPKTAQTPFIANGDSMEIVKVYDMEDLYGFRFADVRVRLSDYDMDEVEVKCILNAIHADEAAMSAENRKLLYDAVSEDYSHIRSRKQRYLALQQDPYLNALQIKFAYAQTCHKTQGGQWDSVFVYQGYVPENSPSNDYYRWLYTAVTRAKKELFVVK
ncbi:MAG: AAA family ATPase [Bacteroidales bacterium]|jgi:exodeoxyribonuclease-5|nr:AAA family ATPase [Bacteroidales bacterium]